MDMHQELPRRHVARTLSNRGGDSGLILPDRLRARGLPGFERLEMENDGGRCGKGFDSQNPELTAVRREIVH